MVSGRSGEENMRAWLSEEVKELKYEGLSVKMAVMVRLTVLHWVSICGQLSLESDPHSLQWDGKSCQKW